MRLGSGRRLNDTWTPEPIWSGKRCFILGGGPSLADVDLARLKGEKVITVNSSLPRAVAAGLDDGVLFFIDFDWFMKRIPAVLAWRGLIVTPSTGAKRRYPDRIKRIVGEWRDDFPRRGAPVIRKGRNGGHTSIGLAHALGCNEVILLGFDMRIVNGRSHHHDEYAGTDEGLYHNLFVPNFKGWDASARAAGMRVRNATPGSALKEFEMVGLEEVLACARL